MYPLIVLIGRIAGSNVCVNLTTTPNVSIPLIINHFSNSIPLYTSSKDTYIKKLIMIEIVTNDSFCGGISALFANYMNTIINRVGINIRIGSYLYYRRG